MIGQRVVEGRKVDRTSVELIYQNGADTQRASAKKEGRA